MKNVCTHFQVSLVYYVKLLPLLTSSLFHLSFLMLYHSITEKVVDRFWLNFIASRVWLNKNGFYFDSDNFPCQDFFAWLFKMHFLYNSGAFNFPSGFWLVPVPELREREEIRYSKISRFNMHRMLVIIGFVWSWREHIATARCVLQDLCALTAWVCWRLHPTRTQCSFLSASGKLFLCWKVQCAKG